MMRMNYTYILECADGTLYTGWTTDPVKRTKDHNQSETGAKYTRARRPVKLVYYEEFESKQEAMRREYEIKHMPRSKKLALICSDKNALPGRFAITRKIQRKKEESKMERHAFAFQIAEGKKGSFRKLLGENWEEIKGLIDRLAIRNFSLWEASDLVFGYFESTDEDKKPGDDDRILVRNMIQKAEEAGRWISKPFDDMRLMYHNFGIVRENKELIRHRVFMTKLHEGCEEEYKKRHDALVEARGDKIDPGPDSNFSIWNAGGYIFGYNEIDTTMERDETEEEHADTVAWETRQLGIMDWVTNDCDWLTGEVHAQVRRLAWYR